ncbi:MAG: hypothetical protein IIB05_11550 [Bacteroidetes bacterium]|nr:hypothetical protein [Bacteroidota bacterium]
MRSQNNIIKKLVTLFAVISITTLTAFNLFGQPQLIAEDPGNNVYPITFTNPDQDW